MKKIKMVKKIICGILSSVLLLTGSSNIVFANETLTDSSSAVGTVSYRKSPQEIEREFNELMKQVEHQHEDEIQTRGPKYDYKTTYGTIINKTVGGYAGNQDRDGTKFGGDGGGFFWSSAGGPSVSASVTFVHPYGTMTIQANMGNKTTHGEFCYVKDTKHRYKLYVKKYLDVKPYITYRKVKGSSVWSVYTKGSVPVVTGHDLIPKRVG